MRLLTIRKAWALPDNPDLPEAGGIALEVDSNVPSAWLIGANLHTCDRCAYVSVHLLLVAVTFKLFIVPREKQHPRCGCRWEGGKRVELDCYCPIHGQDIR